MNTETTTKTAVMLQPGDVVLEHYKTSSMNMTTMHMTAGQSDTDYLVVQSVKPEGKFVRARCQKRRADGGLCAAKTCYWLPNTELEVEA